MMDPVLLDAVERYLRNEMSQEEKAAFERLRENSPETDQLVVEQQYFLKEMDEYAANIHLKSTLQAIHQEMISKNLIREEPPKEEKKGGKLINFWNRYNKTIAVAATIGGITAIVIGSLVAVITPSSKPTQNEVRLLVNELNRTKQQIDKIDSDLKEKEIHSHQMAPSKRDGTGFLIDGAGYLVTNAHVVRMADSVYVENVKGEYFRAAVVHVNDKTDVAILKIADQRFKSLKQLPYGFRKAGTELGEDVFTLGYSRPEIVYGKGYLSAKTGYNGDTVSYQVAISANPGNSGAPLFNSEGEVIGVVSGKQVTAEGVVFAVKAKNIFNAVESLKQDSAHTSIKLPSVSHVKHFDRVQQIKKLEDYVFIVKSY